MSLPKYPKYKDSGVEWLGEVPQGWEIVQSRRLFGERKEKARSDDTQLTASQKYGVIPQSEFMLLEDQKVMQVLTGLDILKHVEPGDFVISMRSFQGGLEFCGFKGCISSAYVPLFQLKQNFAKFFAYLFKSTRYVQALRSTTNLVRDGQALRYSNFTQVDLPSIPLPEQTAIAAFLDRETGKIDALVSEQEKLIALLKEKRQALISHAVTKGLDPKAKMKDSGVEWLGEVPHGWEVTKLRRIAKRVLTGGTPKSLEFEINESFSWYTPGDFNGDLILGESSRKISREIVLTGEVDLFPENSVLVVSIGATLGKVGFIQKPAYSNQQINAIIGSEIMDSYFLAWFLTSMSEFMRLNSNASTIGIMNQEKTKEIPVTLPPLPEQTAIAAFLDRETGKIDALMQEAERGIELLKERRSALISAAVTGKIDVRGLS